MRKTFHLALCVGLLISGVPGLAAAQTATPVPAAPVAPVSADTTKLSVPPVSMLEITKGSDINAAVQDADSATETGQPWSRLLVFKPHGTVPATRVNIEMHDAKFTDLLKAVAEQAKLDYAIDKDANSDVRTSVTLKSVYTYTALNVITESAGLTWNSETHDGKTTVRISKIAKASRANFYQSDAYYDEYLKHLLPVVPSGGNANKPAAKQPLLSSNGISWTFTPSTPNDAVTNLLNEIQTNTTNVPYGISKPNTLYATALRFQETRSTFTCPNCHNQVTILRKNVEVDCPTCHRPFEAGWKVCPFDGTKRPVAKDDWKFCPICGHAIPDGVATLFSTPTHEEASPQYYAYQPSLSFAPLTAPSSILQFIQPPTNPTPTLPVIHPPAGDYK